jgi:leader peptidase (prepilin peptidase)/N-methyltransferase
MAVQLFLVLWCALAGLMIGSFLNVVIWRVPQGLSVVRPPSACPACGAQIRARDNVPVLGWLLLRGRCRDCGNGISIRYPVVELGTAIVFAALAVRLGYDSALPAYLYFGAIGVALALIDFDTKRLPDVLTLPAYPATVVLLGGAALFESHPGAVLRALVGAAVMGGLYFALWFAYPAGMGFGDVKLAPTIGAYLGWLSYGVLGVGVFLGFLYGGVLGIAVMLLGRGGRKTKLPFGPFMLAGALTSILVGQHLANAYLSTTVG